MKEKIYWFKFQVNDICFDAGFKSKKFEKAEELAEKFANESEGMVIEYLGWTEPEDPKMKL